MRVDKELQAGELGALLALTSVGQVGKGRYPTDKELQQAGELGALDPVSLVLRTIAVTHSVVAPCTWSTEAESGGQKMA